MEGHLDTADVLLNRGLNGFGVGGYGGYGGGGYGGGRGGNFHGDGSAVKEAVHGNRALQHESSTAQLGANLAVQNQIAQSTDFQTAAIDRSTRALSEQVDRGHSVIGSQIASNRIEDRFNALAAIITANDKAATNQAFDLQRQISDCCCGLKAGQAELAEKIAAGALTAANAEIARLQADLRDDKRWIQATMQRAA